MVGDRGQRWWLYLESGQEISRAERTKDGIGPTEINSKMVTGVHTHNRSDPPEVMAWLTRAAGYSPFSPFSVQCSVASFSTIGSPIVFPHSSVLGNTDEAGITITHIYRQYTHTDREHLYRFLPYTF